MLQSFRIPLDTPQKERLARASLLSPFSPLPLRTLSHFLEFRLQNGKPIVLGRILASAILEV